MTVCWTSSKRRISWLLHSRCAPRSTEEPEPQDPVAGASAGAQPDAAEAPAAADMYASIPDADIAMQDAAADVPHADGQHGGNVREDASGAATLSEAGASILRQTWPSLLGWPTDGMASFTRLSSLVNVLFLYIYPWAGLVCSRFQLAKAAALPCPALTGHVSRLMCGNANEGRMLVSCVLSRTDASKHCCRRLRPAHVPTPIHSTGTLQVRLHAFFLTGRIGCTRNQR